MAVNLQKKSQIVHITNYLKIFAQKFLNFSKQRDLISK
jgi:hypothetical protein